MHQKPLLFIFPALLALAACSSAPEIQQTPKAVAEHAPEASVPTANAGASPNPEASAEVRQSISSQLSIGSRLFLQQISDSSAIVKWRGETGHVCVASNPKQLERKHRAKCVMANTTAGDHNEAKLTGLRADTEYHYSVRGIAGAGLRFRTAPAANTPPGRWQHPYLDCGRLRHGHRTSSTEKDPDSPGRSTGSVRWLSELQCAKRQRGYRPVPDARGQRLYGRNR